MDEPATAKALAAQGAAEALIALGLPISPDGPDMEHWRIGDFVMTDEELIGLAKCGGVRPLSSNLISPDDLERVFEAKKPACSGDADGQYDLKPRRPESVG